MSEPAALEVREVSAGYGAVPVLRSVTITAQAGTITAVLGANGAGKTTLLRVIDGSIKPSQGQIWLDGANLAGRRPEDVSRAGIAHVPEGQGVITELTVAENLQLGLLLRPRSERAAALADIYNRFSVLADRRLKAAGTLSGGERQMLVIARALATNPRVLLLDEPSLGLAPKIVRDVLDLISQLKDRHRPDHHPGRAERPQRAGHRRPRHRAQPRLRRRHRPGRPARRRRGAATALPGLLRLGC